MADCIKLHYIRRVFITCIAILSLGSLCMAPDEVSLNCYFLTLKEWKYNSKLETKVANGDWIEKAETTLLCEKDDIITFVKGEHCNMGTYEITSGNVKCKDKPDVLKSGKWSMTTNGRYLKMDECEFVVIKLNKDTLQIVRGPNIYKDRNTFIH